MLGMAILPLVFAAFVQISETTIRHQMEEELEQKNLVTVHVHASQVVWTDRGKEAIVNGHMFDVKNYTTNGDHIKLTGLFDNDEDALFAQIDDHQKNNTDGTSDTLILEWFSCFAGIPSTAVHEFFVSEKSLPAPLLRSDFIQTHVSTCDTPPPEKLAV